MRREWPLFIARRINYEYWPWYLFFLPLVPLWAIYVIRSGKLAYFTAVNPAIPQGGLFGESKFDILSAIPEEYKPRSVRVKRNEGDNVLTSIVSNGFGFPVIIKPNVGERGYNVSIVRDEVSLEHYLLKADDDLIIQEYIELPLELGIMYNRRPGADGGEVTSITVKKYLSVTGNGKDSIRDLMKLKARTELQLDRIKRQGVIDLDFIPEAGLDLVLERIGNHCLGTTFINGNCYLGKEIDLVFDRITRNFNGFHYGRFDLKVRDFDSLMKGESIQIFEVNGVTSEPGHIYDPGYKLWEAYRDIARHMKIVFHISKDNMRNGYHPSSAREVVRILFSHFRRKNKTPEVVPGVPSYISEQI